MASGLAFLQEDFRVQYLELMRSSRVYEVAVKSPLEFANVLSERIGASVWLKREDQQPTRSFKLRGAYCKVAALSPEELERGVVAASAGNHAQGVALAARTFGTSAVIVVPETVPPIKAEAIRGLGAELVLSGDSYEDAYKRAQEIAETRNLSFIHPYDDPQVIAGQGTIGIEIVEQLDGIDAVFVPVGGGGLLAGIALAIKQLKPSTKVFGVEPDDSDAMTRSIREGRRVILDRVGGLADGVAVRQVGEEPFRICQQLVDGIITVSNDEICAAVKEIFEDRRAILEPSGALAYAGLRRYVEEQGAQDQRLVAICSGSNLNFDRLRYVAERAEAGEHREAVFAIHIPERPGEFRRLCSAIGNRSVTEFNYRMGDPKQAVVFAGVRVRSIEERQSLFAILSKEYETLDLTDDEIAKTHVRHMVGGPSASAKEERFCHFDFPERSGALGQFLDCLAGKWNISLFHYRNAGGDRGKVLVGFEVPPETASAFEEFRSDVGYLSTDKSHSVALRLFLSNNHHVRSQT